MFVFLQKLTEVINELPNAAVSVHACMISHIKKDINVSGLFDLYKEIKQGIVYFRMLITSY